jgi:hypothetical protein
VKAEHKHLVGLIKPHVILESKWEVISMEFIVGLSLMARRHDSIFVVVETLTKSAHFIPVNTMHYVPDIARFFINDIVRLHGIPKQSYLIEDWCLQDVFGPVSKRPWEHKTLVQHIILRPMGRQKERTKFWNIFCICM